MQIHIPYADAIIHDIIACFAICGLIVMWIWKEMGFDIVIQID